MHPNPSKNDVYFSESPNLILTPSSFLDNFDIYVFWGVPKFA